MNGLDYLILAAIGLGAIFGSARGILRIASSLIALVAAVYLAALYYQAAGAYLARAFSMRPATGAALGYIIVFIAVMVIVAWGGAKLAELIRALHMSWVDRLGGRGGWRGARRVVGGFNRGGRDRYDAGRHAFGPAIAACAAGAGLQP